MHILFLVANGMLWHGKTVVEDMRNKIEVFFIYLYICTVEWEECSQPNFPYLYLILFHT